MKILLILSLLFSLGFSNYMCEKHLKEININISKTKSYYKIKDKWNIEHYSSRFQTNLINVNTECKAEVKIEYLRNKNHKGKDFEKYWTEIIKKFIEVEKNFINVGILKNSVI